METRTWIAQSPGSFKNTLHRDGKSAGKVEGLKVAYWARYMYGAGVRT